MIQFVGPDKKRRAVRLGKIGEADARSIAEHVSHLVEFFGEDKPIDAVTPADCDAWRIWLQQHVGPNTTRRSCGRARQFFRFAVRKRVLTENPFADMKGCAVQANKEREFFIDLAMSQKVLDACPDCE